MTPVVAVSVLLLLVDTVRGGLLYQKGPAASGSGNYVLGTFGGQLPQAVKVIRITNTVAVPVPVPFPVTKNVPYPVSVPKPIPYAVPHPVPVEVTKPVIIQQQIPLEIPRPYQVTQSGSYIPEGLVAPPFNPQPEYQSYMSYSQNSYPQGDVGSSADAGFNPSGLGDYGTTAAAGYSEAEAAGYQGYGSDNGQVAQKYDFETSNSVDVQTNTDQTGIY